MAADGVEIAGAGAAAGGFHIVGIGASAGGLHALRALFATLPSEPGIAFVIVMHLSPEHESHLPGLLQSYTGMPVSQVTRTMGLEPNHVYVIPPNANLNSIDTHLRLSELEERRIDRAPIDHFLRTLAATHDGTAIGVILTGTGSDGSLGLQYIKECGGLTVAQDPQEAAYDGMPRSAIAGGMVDLVLPLARIGAAVLGFCATQPSLPPPEEVVAELAKRSERGFGVYSSAILLRRVRRRMQLHHASTFAEYCALLTREPREAEALWDDLSLMPTEFFRDAQLFDELERRLIPGILAGKSRESDRVRLWTIGCVTGEEAYSLAMLLIEQSAAREQAPRLQVFASDLSDKVLVRARAGVYPREIAASLTSERLERFFNSQQGAYHIKREVQQVVLFIAHDLFTDPPFAHLDLIVCRTLLSRLRPEVRRGVLSLLHYALEPDGIIVVGPDDAIADSGLFELVSEPAHAYRKVAARKRELPLPNTMQPFGPGGVRGTSSHAAAPLNPQTLALTVLERYAPASVLINSDNDIVHFSSTAAAYLRFPGGELTNDLRRLAREPVRFRLPMALAQVRATRRPWASETLYVPLEHGRRSIVLRIEPLPGSDHILIVFDDRQPVESSEAATSVAADNLATLQAGLERLSGQLHDALEESSEVDELADSHRLQQANTELESVLQELMTSKEELQAVNEELQSLNEENRRRVLELTQISNDLQHLLASTGIATLFVSRDLEIARFTPSLGALFDLRVTDIGRPVTDLARLRLYADFATDARRVLETLQPLDREIEIGSRWYLSRLLPYRTQAARVEGIVLTLMDISERRLAEQALEAANRNKDRFLALLSHELRNPLAPISAGVEVLKAAPGDRGLVERMAASMGRQSKQLVRLVDDLLEVSRIQGGKLQLRTERVDLNESLRDALTTIEPSLGGSGHTLECTLESGELRVEGDSQRLTQVFTNLLNNAIRYTPTPGKITVTTARDERCAVVSVKDTGVGMRAEMLDQVFEFFYQGHDGRRASAAGLGVGLALARSLVDMHGGTITARSAGEGQGSEFEIRLPLADERIPVSDKIQA